MPYSIRVTEANHVESQFFDIATITFDTERERAAYLSAIPTHLGQHDCQRDDLCYLVDVLADDGQSHEGNIEISEATAHRLTGIASFEEIRQDQREMLELIASGALLRILDENEQQGSTP